MQASSFCRNIIEATKNETHQFVWPPSDCVDAKERWGIPLNNSVQGQLISNQDQDITELLGAIWTNLRLMD